MSIPAAHDALQSQRISYTLGQPKRLYVSLDLVPTASLHIRVQDGHLKSATYRLGLISFLLLGQIREENRFIRFIIPGPSLLERPNRIYNSEQR